MNDLFFLSLSCVGYGVPDVITIDPSNSSGPGLTRQSFSDTTPRTLPSAFPLYTSASPSIVHMRDCHVLNSLSDRYLSNTPDHTSEAPQQPAETLSSPTRAHTFVLPLCNRVYFFGTLHLEVRRQTFYRLAARALRWDEVN